MIQDQPTLALADDDELHAELMSVWLEHQGYRVLRFASGDELVSWAAEGGSGVNGLLLDVDMPGRDGFQSCREVRALPSFAQVPAVFVSAAMPNNVPEEVVSGACHFIRKDERMFVKLADWLSRNIYSGASPGALGYR
ncbi:MAG: response regulator [Gemmatimonadetes bacterium]|nr:response regulator [Gemmatimonadota bacterium]